MATTSPSARQRTKTSAGSPQLQDKHPDTTAATASAPSATEQDAPGSRTGTRKAARSPKATSQTRRTPPRKTGQAKKAAAPEASPESARPEGATAQPAAPTWHIDPEALSALQAEFIQRFQAQLNQQMSGAAPELGNDRRFAAEAWQKQPLFGWQAAWYRFHSEFLQRSAALVQSDERTQDRLRFAVQQWIDAVSPANFLATNPDAQQRMIETQGESLRQGIQNLLNDLQQGRISQTPADAFEVGRNVCTAPGTVIYQNELVQLIQYQPATPSVGERPLLIIPPAINKYYILDLQPSNSFIGHAVAEGHTVFVVSWRNIQDPDCTLGWDDYLQKGIVDPIHVVQAISGQPTINLLGFCIGGTLLCTALAALAAKGEKPAASLTLLTTLLDSTHPGVLGIFIDEMQLALREATIGQRGIMPGKDLALTFNFLRPNELVWNYVVGNYLKGETPPPFDLLYWNSDSTNLAGPMFCTYLRHLYLQNELVQPGVFQSLGEPVDLRRIDVPTYVLCAREDHIVPWQGGYESAQALGGKPRFVLAASGHIAGVVNPPAKQKRSYATGPDIAGLTPEQWQAQDEEHAGSWWPDWYQWLESYQGKAVPAPTAPGSAQYPPIEPAPGRYVKERI